MKDDLIICFQANQRDEARTMNAAGVLASKIGMKQQSFFSLPDKPRHTEDKRQCLGIYDSTNPIPTLSAAHHHAACFLRKDEEMELKPKLRVRRLLPVECERLMGLPDDWTKIPWNGKPAEECPDSHRYKACGNSMGVNCMRWIGIGIDEAAKRIKTKEGGGK